MTGNLLRPEKPSVYESFCYITNRFDMPATQLSFYFSHVYYCDCRVVGLLPLL